MATKKNKKQAPGGSVKPVSGNDLKSGAKVFYPAKSNFMAGSSSSRGKGC